MVLKPDRERVKVLLKDTITLLCKNGLDFKRNFAVDAVIGVTLDEDEVFLISVNEIVKSETYQEAKENPCEEETNSTPRKRRRKRHRVKDEKDGTRAESLTDGERSETLSAFNQEPPIEQITSKQEPQSDNEDSDDLIMIKEELDSWNSGTKENPSNSSGTGQPYFENMVEAGSSQSFDMSQVQSPGNATAWPFSGDPSLSDPSFSDPNAALANQFRSVGPRSSVTASAGVDLQVGDLSKGKGPEQVGPPKMTY